MKALGIAAAAVMAFAPLSVVATAPGVAQAAPCAGVGSNPTSCWHCMFYARVFHTANVCNGDGPPRPAQAPPSRVPVPEAPPPLPSMAPVPPEVVPPSPPPPSTIPVQTPKISQGPGTATDAEPTQPPQPWWPPWTLVGGVLVMAVCLLAWMINRLETKSGSDR